MWQIIGYWLGWSGSPGKGRAVGVGEVKFRGDIKPDIKRVRYEVSMRQVRRGKLAVGIAEWQRVCRRRMRISRQGYEGRTDSIRDLRSRTCHAQSTAAMRADRDRHQRRLFVDRGHATPLTDERRQKTSGHTDQEQIQMIATAIGTPKPSAPKIATTNSESRFAWCRTPDGDMTLLLGAPRASARPQDERSIAPSDQGPWRLSMTGNAGALWLTSG